MVGARGQPMEGCFPWDGIHVPICATVRTIPLCTTNCIYIIFWRTKVSLLVKVDGAYRLTTFASPGCFFNALKKAQVVRKRNEGNNLRLIMPGLGGVR